MPRRHIETRNIVFHICAGSSRSLGMMKTEFPTNDELPIPKEREHRRGGVIQDHRDNRSERVEAEDSSGKEKKQSLFRRPSVIIAAAALAIAGIGYGAFAMFHSFTHESTDDAFVDAHILLTAPKIAGRVATVHINDNQDVKNGDLLVEIDPADAKAAIQQAELNLSYTKIFAPEDGRVTKKAVEPGDYVQVGQDLFALVTPERWTTANFKETQLRTMRPGQRAQVSVDAYPDHPLRGHVDSIQAGSGARFSLLPPENATGNYVKVVQRVPVKIVLDEQPDVQRALGPGMSVVPTVAMDHGNEAAFIIAIIAVVLAAGVIFGAALWIGRVKKEQA